MIKKAVFGLFVISVVVSGVLLYQSHFSQNEPVERPNYEVVAELERVIDGDTVVVNIKEIVSPRRGVEVGKDRVRLAGIDTEELEQREAAKNYVEVENMTQSEYEETIYYQRALEAGNLLKSVLPEGREVFLDLDDLAWGRGPYRGVYGRLIAVIYVEEDEGWLNANAFIANKQYSEDRGSEYPVCTRFISEFNPYDWLEEDYRFA